MNQNRPNNNSAAADTAILAAVLALGAITGGHWLAAAIAALLGRRQMIDGGFVESLEALTRMPDHWGDPRRAWSEPAASSLPGPVVYWFSVGLVVAAVIAGVVWWLQRRVGRSEPIDKRRRLGVEAQPRLATTKDLKRLLAKEPERGRLVLGHWGRQLLMTESDGSERMRGVKGAVLLFGPSQSGKTTRLIESVNSWIGPAVVSSVKTDLMYRTIEQRRRVGDVKVFDPLGISGQPCATWSPLRAAKTISGAIAAAQILARTGGDDGPADRFWRGQAEQLLAAMLWTAANTEGHTMRHVVRWVLEMDRPDGDNAGTLAPLVRLLADHDDEATAFDAREVRGWLEGQWSADPRTTSSIYATARNAVWPWADRGVTASADRCEITLDWLTRGENTLYLVAPVGDETRVGIVFAALLQDLITQTIDRYSRAAEPLDPRLLVVLDEAANTPLPKLPEWAATITGIGIQLVTVWQSKAQLDHAFGANADNVLTNHRTKLILPSGLSDRSTAEYISALVGQEHVRADLHRSAQRSPQDARNVATAVPLFPADILRRMRVGEALLLHGSLPPAWLRSI
jgi:type IV secretion system protein VirD4